MTGVIAVVAAIAAVMYWQRHRGQSDSSGDTVAAGSTGAPAATAADPPRSGSGIPTHVAKLSPDERRKLADRIAAAQAGRGAVSATPRPKLPDTRMPGTDTDGIRTSIQSAMREANPILKECYDKSLPKLGEDRIEVRAQIRLTGDPDVGTLIDADRLTDPDGKPLLDEFDDCLRNTFQSLGLPPLVEGNKVRIAYTLVFSSRGPP
jgi:hypothetical protein